jgi:presenilin 1
VSILIGLGTTLSLLAVFRKALPALPISILIAVAFNFLTRLVIVPFVEETVWRGAWV